MAATEFGMLLTRYLHDAGTNAKQITEKMRVQGEIISEAIISHFVTGENLPRQEVTVYRHISTLFSHLIREHVVTSQDQARELVRKVPFKYETRLAVRLRDTLEEEVLNILEKQKALDRQQERLTASYHELPDYQKVTRQTSLIGRKKELKEILLALQDERYPIVTITGITGVGKTKLALAVTKRITQGMFPGGYKYISLVPVTNPEDTPRQIANMLGVPGEPTARNIAAILPNTRTLLIIDNLEHVMESQAEFFFELLDVCQTLHKSLKLLFTSQQPLNEQIEQNIPLSPLKLPPKGTTLTTEADLQRYDATNLFYQRARIQTFPEEDVYAITCLCKSLGGLPLAIELVAARVSNILSPQAIYAGFTKSGLAEVEYRYRYNDPRHISLEKAIAWSYDLLTEDEQKLFRRLAVFGFKRYDNSYRYYASYRDAEEICDISGDLKSKVKEIARRLILYNLIDDDHSHFYPGFRMLYVLYEFANQRLHELPEEARKIRDNYFAYYGAWLDPTGIFQKRKH